MICSYSKPEKVLAKADKQIRQLIHETARFAVVCELMMMLNCQALQL